MDNFKQPTHDTIKQMVAAYRRIKDGLPILEKDKAEYEHWEGLFAKYNEAATAKPSCGFFPLRMGCVSCYLKVYTWNKKQEQSQDSVNKDVKEC